MEDDLNSATPPHIKIKIENINTKQFNKTINGCGTALVNLVKKYSGFCTNFPPRHLS